MLVHQVALVSDTTAVTFAQVAQVSAALQKQASRDFEPLWGVKATVDPFETLEDVPVDYWPVIIKDDIGDPQALGYHQDDHGQPFSLVAATAEWPLTASHECLEMLADPFGSRTVAGAPPSQATGRAGALHRVVYLVEVCDPCEAEGQAYSVNNVTVSDFITPHYYDPVATSSVRYSFGGAISEPHQVLDGGYVSFGDPKTNEWFQVVVENGQAQTRSLGVLQPGKSLREQIDARSRTLMQKGAAAQTRGAASASAMRGLHLRNYYQGLSKAAGTK